jgi:dihydrofolate reductase
MKAIFAVDSAGGIGKNGSLPWPKQHTLNQTILMGRGTWDDPAFPKPLPNRTNIVLTSQAIDLPNVISVQSIDDERIQDAIVIGGAKLITSIADRIDTIYLTRFDQCYDCDTFIDAEVLLDDFYIIERIQSTGLAFETWKKCNNT